MNEQDKCTLCKRAFKIGEIKLTDKPFDPNTPAFCYECALGVCLEKIKPSESGTIVKELQQKQEEG